MASTRPVPGHGGDGVDLLGSAAALRWSRPDLTGSIADHVLEIADADADDALWLRAAGWAVYARSATGDGRGVASVVLGGVARRGDHILDEPAAHRLRVELAVLATGADRPAAARNLLTPVAVAGTAPELRADALGALSRCGMADRPATVEGLLRRVDATWMEVGGRRGHVGAAAASLVAAAAERRAGRPEAAVERAAAGLAALERARGSRAQSPSRHLAAGLAAEWLSGLLDAGRTDEAREGCGPVEPRLRDTSRPSRQIALLRLTVARTVTGTGVDAVAQAVAQAARDAVASDAPDLEAVCWSTLAALQKKSGQLGESLESTRRGEAARGRDEERARRFQAALDSVVPVDPGDRAPREPLRVNRDGARHRTDRPVDSGVWTDWSSAVARDRTVAPTSPAHRPASNGTPRHGSTDTTDNGAADNGAADNGAAGGGPSNGVPRPPSTGIELEVSSSTGAAPEDISPWQDWTEDSPIGRLLARSLQADEPSARKQPEGTRPPHRYPDAVTDPWSTGSWSTGHWAAADQPGPHGSADRDRPFDEPRAGRGGRRRRADPEDGFPATATAAASGAEAVEQDGTESSMWARGSDRGSHSGDRPAADAGERGSPRHDAHDARLDAEDPLSGQGRPRRDMAEAGRDTDGEHGDGQPADTSGWAVAGWATAERAVPVPTAEQRRPGGRAAGERGGADPGAGRVASGHGGAERSAADRVVGQSAVAECAAADDVTAEPGAAERAAAEWAEAERAEAERAEAVEQAAAERSAVEKPAAERGAAENSAVERAAVERAAVERAAVERAAVERAAVERAAVERAAVERAAVERAAVERAVDLAVEPGSGSWLQNALAELDRELAASVPVASRPPAPAPEAEGCVVVVDLARDGRRFAGRRAGSVMRALAERLADRLPDDARLRHDDSDALSVVLPGWTRSPATEWMHRTLPGLFEEFVTDEDLPGTQLRAAVHDTDGPVGAQLLQRLDGPGRARPAPDHATGGPLRESPPSGGGRRHRRAAEEEQPEGPLGAAGTTRPDPAADTDGLGLADLLAGALAAYRGI